MITFTAIAEKFGSMGEKTGWTYAEIPAEVAQKLKPDTKVSFRVKGFIDNYWIERIALIPMGEGNFIIPLNATIRKGTGARKGTKLTLKLEYDDRELETSSDLLECLAEDEVARDNFYKLPKAEQNYFHKWIESAKTAPTKEKRLTMAMDAFSKGWKYYQMIRAAKGEK